MSLQNEGLLNLAGWAAGDVRSGVQEESNRPWASFRFVWTPRWFDRSNAKYVDMSSNFLTVWCYWELARNVQSSLHKGDPLMVLGRLRVVERKVEGKYYDDCSVLASAVGHNLAWGTSMFRRVKVAKGPAPAEGGVGGDGGGTVLRPEHPPWEVETQDGQAA